MVWKRDLAKLRQALKASETPTPPPKAHKAPQSPPPSAPPPSLEEEDALFLQAMGHRPASTPAPRSPKPDGPCPAEAPAQEQEPASFLEAMKQLKGLKRNQPILPADMPPPAPVPPPEPTPPAEIPREQENAPQPAPPVEPLPSPPIPTGPMRIQLAAGMAIDVDGSLDLRGHSPQDAYERLVERIHDARFLGWRTLHVHLGPAQELHETFLAFLATPLAQTHLARYAQAPIPMGGHQAWILYLSTTPGLRPEAS